TLTATPSTTERRRSATIADLSPATATCTKRSFAVSKSWARLTSVSVRGGSLRPLPQAADVVIVGAGIMGLATAYHLAKDHARRRILVIDESYLCGGASGRNGGGVRAQWSSEA